MFSTGFLFWYPKCGASGTSSVAYRSRQQGRRVSPSGRRRTPLNLVTSFSQQGDLKMKQSLATLMAIAAVLVFTSVASAGLTPSELGDPAIPDLIYDSATGEVTLDVDASPGIIGYSLQNATNSFIPGNFTPILVGVSTALTSQLEEAALASGSGSIGLVFPTGLDLAGLTSLLTVRTVSTSLGAPLLDFDLVVLSATTTTTTGTTAPIPEPATITLSLLGAVGLALYSWRRRRS
ncbi:MAG: PEP-CTERM sorting domain-containing protein [Planctomycetota bacterium]|nr:MAG: PEP-CTERM sorting domain-containing protein [Planctomycetota bacterium]REK49249.1 MAG: PEP-CTERM sorting domain-containing protein [Planctomycetota bacterium]